MMTTTTLSKNKPCPQCRSNGRDKTGNHLFLMRDGNRWMCSRCGYTESNGDFIPHKKVTMTPYEIKEYPILAIEDRKITKDTCKHFGVMTSVSEQNGEPESHYYPITKKGEITGYKVRKLPKQF